MEAGKAWDGALMHDYRDWDRWVVYGLCDRETRAVFYIGQSKCSMPRYLDHLRKYPRAVMFLLEEVTAETVAERERHWIATYRAAGVFLHNKNDGGSGRTRKKRTRPETWREKQAAWVREQVALGIQA